MPVFKINVSQTGKTLKIESDSEALIGKKIGENLPGEEISPELQGYELEITGTSDIAGFPGFKGHEGPALKRVLLTRKDKGMNNSQKGLRLRKTIRGGEISEKTVQINTIVKKQGNKKFEDLLPKKEAKPEPEAEKPTEEKKEPEKKPAEEKKE